MNRPHRAGSTIILLILFVLIIVGIVGISLLLKSTIMENRAVSLPSATSAPLAGNTLENAPFILCVNESRIGAQDYVSFTVYFSNQSSQELVYTCGRMFPANDVRAIAWSGYDICVTFTDDTRQLYTFDGSGAWQ